MGSILNSKAEYNRCHILRMKVEEEEEAKNREELSKKSREQTARELDMEQRNWEKTKGIDKERRSKVTTCLPVGSRKRIEEEEQHPGLGSKGRKRKKLRYAIVEED